MSQSVAISAAASQRQLVVRLGKSNVARRYQDDQARYEASHRTPHCEGRADSSSTATSRVLQQYMQAEPGTTVVYTCSALDLAAVWFEFDVCNGSSTPLTENSTKSTRDRVVRTEQRVPSPLLTLRHTSRPGSRNPHGVCNNDVQQRRSRCGRCFCREIIKPKGGNDAINSFLSSRRVSGRGSLQPAERNAATSR